MQITSMGTAKYLYPGATNAQILKNYREYFYMPDLLVTL